MVEDPKWLEHGEPGNTPALEFTHQHRGRSEDLSVYIWKIMEDDKNEGNFAGIDVLRGEQEVGSIDGQLFITENETTFYSLSINNYTKEDNLSKIPRAMGATVANLVKYGVITNWNSSPGWEQPEDIRKMYDDYLRNDPELEVSKSTGGDDFFRVRKK